MHSLGRETARRSYLALQCLSPVMLTSDIDHGQSRRVHGARQGAVGPSPWGMASGGVRLGLGDGKSSGCRDGATLHPSAPALWHGGQGGSWERGPRWICQASAMTPACLREPAMPSPFRVRHGGSRYLPSRRSALAAPGAAPRDGRAFSGRSSAGRWGRRRTGRGSVSSPAGSPAWRRPRGSGWSP